MRKLIGGLLASTLIITSGAATSAPPGSSPDSFPVKVINNSNEPIPVVGTISADVSGKVEVTSGSVDVTSVPASLTDRLDEIVDQLDILIDGSNGQQVADFAKTFVNTDIDANGGFLFEDFGVDVLVSFITISTENDRGRITFGNSTQGTVLNIGNRNVEFPTVLVLPLPQPLLISELDFQCFNTAEDCEVRVSVIGTRVE